jgi:hypothetical protein
MPIQLINTLASIGTLLLLAATVVAGIIQLRHMRAGNELKALLAIERDFRSPEVQDALTDVQDHLAERIEQAEYRAQIGAPGYVDPSCHPEMILCNWFNRTGALVRGGFIKEDLFLESFGRLVAYYWQLLVPVVAILRRTRGAGQYAAFEYLAARATSRGTRHAVRRPARLMVSDPWLDADRQEDRRTRSS